MTAMIEATAGRSSQTDGSRASHRRRPRGYLADAALILVVLTFALPTLFLVGAAFLTDRALISPGWTAELTLNNLSSLFAPDQPFAIQLLNSVMIVVGTVVLCGGAAVPAGYSLAKLSLAPWLRYPVAAACAVLPLLPPMTLVPGFYLTLNHIGLLGTIFGLIVLNTVLNLPFATLLMKLAFDEVPPALREAALLDGARESDILFKVMLPLVGPSLATSSLFTAIMTWNEFLMGLTMTSGGTTAPLSVGIATLVQPYDMHWGQLAAAGSVAVVPIVLIGIFANRRLVAGMTRGAVK